MGQRQLLSFTRAMVIDPNSFLDEATASVDPYTENLIMRSFNELLLNRTSIVIAHRLRTIVDSDRIFLIKDGAIVESGTHNELVELGSEYYSLFRLLESQWHESIRNYMVYSSLANSSKVSFIFDVINIFVDGMFCWLTAIFPRTNRFLLSNEGNSRAMLDSRQSVLGVLFFLGIIRFSSSLSPLFRAEMNYLLEKEVRERYFLFF